MNPRIEALLRLLDLERLEVNLFRGVSQDIGSPQVFGGQVLGQALVAASRTVEGRLVHSLHAYFLRRGDIDAPIVYQVERSRDGGHFTSRRVVAIQHGQPILTMSSSFQAVEEGVEHQLPMPQVPPPEQLHEAADLEAEILSRVPQKVARFFEHQAPFEFRPVRPPDYVHPEKREPVKHVWFRLIDAVTGDQALHRCLLAYVSDYHLLDSANLPHGRSFFDLQMASIDHVLWIHRPLRVDEWLLYAIDSPNAASSRGSGRTDSRAAGRLAGHAPARQRPGLSVSTLSSP
jgi:acyl-CoA thioesterase II